MSEPDLNQFFQTIKDTAKQSFADGKSMPEMMRVLFEKAEKKAEASLCDDQLKHMDCKKGCSVCCHVNVAVLAPEAETIAEHIMANTSDAEMDVLKENMSGLLLNIKFLTDEERLFLHRPCVFLDEDGGCGIYDVRPLLCRSITSADADACVSAIKMVALNQGVLIPMNITQKVIMDTAFKALAEAMDEHGISSVSRELTDSVFELL